MYEAYGMFCTITIVINEYCVMLEHGNNRVVLNKRCVIEEKCGKRGFEHERNTMNWIGFCVGLGLC